MLTQAKETADKKEGFLKGAINVAEQVVQTGLNVEKLKERASLAIEEGVVDAKRLVKRGVYAAEDIIDDTEHLIKKEPFASVGVTFGVGVAIGALLGWFVAYKSRPARDN